jgi:gentisate 1,2-dioxygenase
MTTISAPASGAPSNETALATLMEAAASQHAEPLWPVISQLATAGPKPRAVPHVWDFATMRPLCAQAAELVGTEYAERRVFSLINPALANPFTTDTLYAGLQTILPGEVARAHRHTIFALRFIMEGSRAYTSVEGEKLMMTPGDVILTPQMEWHDHGNEGDAIMIWMDGLDHPLWRTIPLVFADHYASTQYPSAPPEHESVRRYSWAEKAAALDAVAGPTAEVRYVHRGHGGDIGATIGASALRIDAGAATAPLRETSSSIINVYSGSGTVTVGDVVLPFRRGDILAIPAWKTVSIASDPSTPSYLFRMDDKPLVRAINAYRSDDGNGNWIEDGLPA